MLLSPGARLGPYEILAPAGAGGMGEVYRARDTRLDRTVAIKVLPPELAKDEERRARFEREARAASTLNHPHICAVYDVGRHDGIDFLVLEYLDGTTLAAALENGPLPIDQVLRYGAQIADALDRAHRAGLVHRDLKPSNVMVTRAGAKLLDFGLAKTAATPAQVDTSSPTQTRPLTGEGALVGTLPYMAPEQVEGRPADTRTDIFALGALLHEMATGSRAFDGRSPASLVAAILTSEPPPVRSLQPLSPPGLDRVVRGCIAKDPEERWQSARDVAHLLNGLASPESAPAPAARIRTRERAFWALACLGLAVALAAALLGKNRTRRGAPNAAGTGPAWVSVLPPDGADVGEIALSPDGGRIAFTATSGDGRTRLWVRSLDSPPAHALEGTELASYPFWSPDGRFLAYFAGDKLYRVEVGGGRPQLLCPAPMGAGGSWSRGGTIVFGSVHGPVRRIEAGGGSPQPVTTLVPGHAEMGHLWPVFLPDGVRFLYLRDARRTEDHRLVLAALDGRPETTVSEGLLSNAVPRPSGHLLLVRDGSLIAQPWDAQTVRFTGEPRSITAPVAFTGDHYYAFSPSETDALVVRTGRPESRLVWLDRAGRELGVAAEAADYVHVELSPNGRRAVLERVDAQRRTPTLWVLDLDRGVASRLGDESWSAGAFWSPDGARVAYSSNPAGKLGLYARLASGVGPRETIAEGDVYGWSWTANGLLVETSHDQTRSDLATLALGPPPRLAHFAQSAATEHQAQASPDGRWVAYTSDESGTREVYAQPLPPTGERWQVSTRGGRQPRWRRDGRELYYLEGQRLMAVDVEDARPLSIGPPRPLFAARFKQYQSRYGYAVSADGQRFLANLEDSSASLLTLVWNWTAVLGRAQ
jgi:Tol biopolymer transport system component